MTDNLRHFAMGVGDMYKVCIYSTEANLVAAAPAAPLSDARSSSWSASRVTCSSSSAGSWLDLGLSVGASLHWVLIV